MPTENGKRFCPLCKRLIGGAAAEAAAHTRLCHECQSLVRTIIPESSPLAVALPQTPAVTMASHSPTDADRRFGGTAPPPLEEAPAQAIPDQTAASEADFPPTPTPFEYLHDTNPELQAPPQARYLTDSPQADWHTNNEMSAAGNDEAWTYEANAEAAKPEPIDGQDLASTSADPWGNPLPATETSFHEWPLLVEPQPRRSRSKRIIPLLLLLLVALGAAFYWYVYRPRWQSQSVTPGQPTVTTTPPQTPSQTPPQAPSQPPTAPSTSSSASPQPTSTPTTTPTPAQAPDGTGGEGILALQAMSSSSAEEANKFSERLLRAGIPAYVVAANIKGKGKWFRVRIGRFKTQEEAQSYANQAQARARAANINLTLIVTSYDKP